MPAKGYMRVMAVSPKVTVADVDANYLRIVALSHEAAEDGAQLVLFPELSLTGYTCGDLFRQQLLLEKAQEALLKIADLSESLSLTIVVGLPLIHDNRLYNCAAVCAGGEVKGLVPKTYLPNHSEFYEKRWFASANLCPEGATTNLGGTEVPLSPRLLFRQGSATFGIEICEDLWAPLPPSTYASIAGADVILNLSASNELAGKHDYLLQLIRQQSARCICGYVYASAGYGESSTDVVYAGNAIVAENGTMLAESPRFSGREEKVTADIDLDYLEHDRINSTFADATLPDNRPYRTIEVFAPAQEVGDELLRPVQANPFVPADDANRDRRFEEIFSIQAHGLAQRLRFTHCQKLVVGISGGLDSTLALLVAVRSFQILGLPLTGIIGITMPAKATSDRTLANALTLMKELGVTSLTIPIGEAVQQHFKDIGHDGETHDAAYENSQARERTQILMDYANKAGGMVLGTGDLSELALGWCTYNGDHMSMYGVNASVPKTLVQHLVLWYASKCTNPEFRKALVDVVDTPISPELIPADSKESIGQKTEDLVGPYELHDFFLYETLRHGSTPEKTRRLARKAFGEKYDMDAINHWLQTFYRRFFNQQFKRSCLPDGPKVGSAALSPRGDWRMPSDASSAQWLKEFPN